LSRRTASHGLGAAILVALLALLTMPAVVTAAEAPVAVRLLFLQNAASPDAPAARLGVQQGVTEANSQGQFLGLAYTLHEAGWPLAAAGPPAGLAAVIAAVEATALGEIARRFPDVPVLNVTETAPAARALCLPNLLHTAPSQGMLAAATTAFRSKHPGTEAEAHAWDPSYEKYAALQLNRRFSKSFGQPMGDPAYGGWVAIKALADATAQASQAAPGAAPTPLLAHLRHDFSFDGQKGAPLSFRADGQLSAPLLLLEGGRIVGEAVAPDGEGEGLAACGTPQPVAPAAPVTRPLP
jgi:hypothetical protein